MTTLDFKRLKYLLEHYENDYTHSHKALEKYRKSFELGIPDSRPRRPANEWEGPFFCRVIRELLSVAQKSHINQLRIRPHKVQESRKAARRGKNP